MRHCRSRISRGVIPEVLMTWRDYLWPEGNSPDKRRARHASGELITPSPPNGRLARSTSMARSSDALPNVRQHGTVLPMRHCRIRVQQQRNTYSLCETPCDKPPPRGDIRCRAKKPTWQRIQRPWFCARSHHEGAMAHDRKRELLGKRPTPRGNRTWLLGAGTGTSSQRTVAGKSGSRLTPV